MHHYGWTQMSKGRSWNPLKTMKSTQKGFRMIYDSYMEAFLRRRNSCIQWILFGIKCSWCWINKKFEIVSQKDIFGNGMKVGWMAIKRNCIFQSPWKMPHWSFRYYEEVGRWQQALFYSPFDAWCLVAHYFSVSVQKNREEHQFTVCILGLQKKSTRIYSGFSLVMEICEKSVANVLGNFPTFRL